MGRRPVRATTGGRSRHGSTRGAASRALFQRRPANRVARPHAARSQAIALFTAHLAGLDTGKRVAITSLNDDELTALHAEAASSADAAEPGHRNVPATLLRAAAQVTAQEGPLAVFDVLDEHTEAPIAVRGTHSTPDVLVRPDGRAGDDRGPRVRSVLDPACGSGRLLAAVAALEPGADVHGQEYRPVTAPQAGARLAETAPQASVDVRTGDSLRDDAFPGLHADAVVCNPPYGDRDWGHDELALDTRWAYGVPPRSEPELAWVQHALAHLAEGGHAVLLLPPATASRSSGRRIRADLLRQGRCAESSPSRRASPSRTTSGFTCGYSAPPTPTAPPATWSC